MREDGRLASSVGVTPVLLRLAWDFLKKGLGTHYVQHKDYDNVVVSEMYQWTVVDSEGQAALRVTFKQGLHTIRYVEFGIRGVGAGGFPLIHELT